MRENLIFYGLTGQDTPQPGPINCETQVRYLIKDTRTLDIEMVFKRVHRLGGKRAKKPRSIVVKFQNYTNRDRVRLKSYEGDLKQKLKERKQGVGIRSPQIYRDARKALRYYIKSERIN
jgi:hypothetical protein